ncbi:hypothetical protein SAMN05661091_6125 [Paenibacillus uliginis N3/975]|uniref:Uncharacterized protein n=1 Tax=Paenibacillus uliginis N3/975 TaxID=1313296 RepID=A0A1X7HTY3_9BACL|nr:hypothetical protein [Paenibacillus uliginis]SMF92972.1 hypothetical protein SAMN05661091_6125 [Paenibacillus uliginis N3/975]
MLYLLYKNSRDLHRDIVEKVLMSIHEIKSDLQTEQLHTRIEKTLAASALEEPDRLEQSAEAD